MRKHSSFIFNSSSVLTTPGNGATSHGEGVNPPLPFLEETKRESPDSDILVLG